MKNDNNLVPVERLFVSYDKMKTEISLLQISLQNTVLDDEEIESMALSHPVGTNDCGKSSVFNTSQKVADIAISIDGKLKKERSVIKKRISLLTNAIQQIDIYVNTLSEFDRKLFNDRYILKKSRASIVAEYNISGDSTSLTTISAHCKKIKYDFYTITPFTADQMIEATGKYKGYYERNNKE